MLTLSHEALSTDFRSRATNEYSVQCGCGADCKRWLADPTKQQADTDILEARRKRAEL